VVKIATFAKPETVGSKCIKTATRHKRVTETDKKKTILTGEHRHTKDTTNGQRVSRHSLPALLCFNFFPTAQKILKFYANPQTAHWLLPQPHRPTLQAKTKEPFLPTHWKMTPSDRIILPILETLNFEYKTT